MEATLHVRQEANLDRYMRGEHYEPISNKIPVTSSALVPYISVTVGASPKSIHFPCVLGVKKSWF